MGKTYFARLMLSGMLPAILVTSCGEQNRIVTLTKEQGKNKIDVAVDSRPFTTFLYPDTLEKPVLWPIYTTNRSVVTRGFPLDSVTGEPTDHPHHIGLWLTFENVNGLDFWNNSYAVPTDKKQLYGWIRTDSVLTMKSGNPGQLRYHANWTNQTGKVLLEETTTFLFTERGHKRVIDRLTVLKADSDVVFKDSKDGMLGIRVAHALQIPSTTAQKFTDDKGNVTTINAATDKIATGNYLTSEGKHGDSAWSTRGVWCKMYGRVGQDSVTIAIIDHPGNPNYPTFWHARGYGLFAANPLAEAVFTNGKTSYNLKLKKGQDVRFYYRIVIADGSRSMDAGDLNKMAQDFAKSPPPYGDLDTK